MKKGFEAIGTAVRTTIPVLMQKGTLHRSDGTSGPVVKMKFAGGCIAGDDPYRVGSQVFISNRETDNNGLPAAYLTFFPANGNGASSGGVDGDVEATTF